MVQPCIGFIGQGFIGKHMADEFETRGYDTVRYSLEAKFVDNKAALRNCSVVFIAVPTPTTPDGFDFSIIEQALRLLGDGTTAVIKSTVLPGTTEQLQERFPALYILHAPEFLREQSAAEDTKHPERNIIGIPHDSEAFRSRAEAVLAVLPVAPYSVITSTRSAECIKYIGNSFLYTKLLFMNIAYDFTQAAGAEWNDVREAVSHDSRIGNSHTNAVQPDGRGAGGHCFIKDFEAFLDYCQDTLHDSRSTAVLTALRNKNNQLLLDTHKDLDLLHGVYDENVPN